MGDKGTAVLRKKKIDGRDFIWRESHTAETSEVYIFESAEILDGRVSPLRRVYGSITVKDAELGICDAFLSTPSDGEIVHDLPIADGIKRVEEHAFLVSVQQSEFDLKGKKNKAAFLEAIQEVTNE